MVGFTNLPTEIVQLILLHLPANEIGKMSLICSLFRHVQTENFWKTAYIKKFPDDLVLESGKQSYKDTFKKRFNAEFYDFYNWTIIKYDGSITLVLRQETVDDEYRTETGEDPEDVEEVEETEDNESEDEILPPIIAIQFPLSDPATYYLRYNECDWKISNHSKTVQPLEEKFTLPPWINTAQAERQLRQYLLNSATSITLDVPFVPKLEAYPHCQTNYYGQLELFYRCGYSSHEMIIKHPDFPCSITAESSWSGWDPYTLVYYYAFSLPLRSGYYEDIPELCAKKLWKVSK